MIDRESDDVNVFNAVDVGVLKPVRVIPVVTVTAIEDDIIGDIDGLAVKLWLTRVLDETVKEEIIVCVPAGVSEYTDDSDVDIEIVTAAVELKDPSLEDVDNGDADDTLDFVVKIEYVGVSVGIDAFAEWVEPAVMVPVTVCEIEFKEDRDAVFDCIADAESESKFDTVAPVDNEDKAVTEKAIVPVWISVPTAVWEFEETDVTDGCSVSLDISVLVAPGDCDTLGLTDDDTREDDDSRALPDDNDEMDAEPELLLLILLVDDANTVLVT